MKSRLRSRPLHCGISIPAMTLGVTKRRTRCEHIWSAHGILWNIDATDISFQLDVCRLDDWCPAGNLALHQCGERWLAAPRLVWNVTADFRQPPTHVLVVE